jgi:hypothetical protein
MTTLKPVLSPALSPSEEIAAADFVAAHGLCSREDANPDHWLPSSVDKPLNPDRLRRARARADRQCRVEAKSGKEQCEARTACLLLALARSEKHGIWGGLIPADLTALAIDPKQVETLLDDYRTRSVATDRTADQDVADRRAGETAPTDTGDVSA